MTISNAKYANIWRTSGSKPPFSGWQIDDQLSYLFKDGDSPYIRNARIDGSGTVIRPGYIQFSTTLSGTGTYPNGIASYLRKDSANDRLIVAYDKSGTEKLISIDDAGTQTAITTGANITVSTRMNFLNVQDFLYCMNGTDAYWKLNGTTYTTPATGIANFKPSFAVSFNGHVWASWWSDNPDKVYRSVSGNGDDFAGAGSGNIPVIWNVTGLASTLQSMFIFTKDSVYTIGQSDLIDVWGTLSYQTRPLQVKEWAVNHASIVSAGNFVFFVTPTRKIMKVERSVLLFDTNDLTHRQYTGVSKYMASLDADQSNCWWYYLPDKNLVVWHFKTIGSTFNNTTLVYDLDKDVFLFDDNKYFFGGCQHKTNYFTISNLEPKIYYDEHGLSDDNTAIPFVRKSKKFTFWDITRKKELWEIRLWFSLNELATLIMETYADWQLIDTSTFVGTSQIWGIGTTSIGTVPIGEWGSWVPLNDFSRVIPKSRLQKRATTFEFVWLCNSIGAELLLQDFDVMIEHLNTLVSNDR